MTNIVKNPQKGDIVLHKNGYRAKVIDLGGSFTGQESETLYNLRILEGTPRCIGSLRQEFTFPAPEARERIECAAYHEAGHLAIAAVQGLTLRPEGFMVDLGGMGLARYATEPGETDVSRESIVLATFAGFSAETRFCDERRLRVPEFVSIVLSPDWVEARTIIRKFSDGYASGDNLAIVQSRLENRSKQLVEQHWFIIRTLANFLLSKEPEPMKPLESGEVWSYENQARYVAGPEAVAILARHGIVATCSPRQEH
jgi:hypothetical protein